MARLSHGMKGERVARPAKVSEEVIDFAESLLFTKPWLSDRQIEKVLAEKYGFTTRTAARVLSRARARHVPELKRRNSLRTSLVDLYVNVIERAREMGGRKGMRIELSALRGLERVLPPDEQGTREPLMKVRFSIYDPYSEQEHDLGSSGKQE